MAEFDALGDVYERSVAELPFREYLEHYSVRRAVGEVRGLAVLDLGCGTGVYTRRLADWGARRVVGVDVSSGMLATASGRDTERARPVEYLVRDAAHPAVADAELDGEFDLVVSVYVLCYAATEDELVGFFTTAYQALRPGGRFVAATLNPDYGRGRDYYARYGFTLTQRRDGEGAPVTLDATLPSGGRLSVTACWWSRQRYEKAATTAGFAAPVWTEPVVSSTGIAKYGPDYWAAYLHAPQALILHAKATA